jgi:hypothetical protein
MITYEQPRLWQRAWFLASVLVLGVLSGVATWWWLGRAGSGAPVNATTAAASAALPKPAVHIDTALLVPPTISPDGRPSDFKEDEWAALREAMSKTAKPQAELDRVVKYLRFQKGFEQWQALQESPDVAQRHQLARRLLEQVPDRLREGEVTMGEALLLESALWSDLEPNEDARRLKLEQAQAQLVTLAPQPDGEQQSHEAALQVEYKRREAAIVADWQAKPPAERNQARLEDALEAARRSVYAVKN